jgi:hypothetical protein
MHLNAQSIMLKFNEFLLTMKTYPMDVALLSETWLRNQKELRYSIMLQYKITLRSFVIVRSPKVGVWGI